MFGDCIVKADIEVTQLQEYNKVNKYNTWLTFNLQLYYELLIHFQLNTLESRLHFAKSGFIIFKENKTQSKSTLEEKRKSKRHSFLLTQRTS